MIDFAKKVTDNKGIERIVGCITHKGEEVAVITGERDYFQVKEKGTFLCRNISYNAQYIFTMRIDDKKLKVYLIKVIASLKLKKVENLSIVSLCGNHEKLSTAMEEISKEYNVIIVHNKRTNECKIACSDKELLDEIEKRLKKRISFIHMEIGKNYIFFPLGKENFMRIKKLCLTGK